MKRSRTKGFTIIELLVVVSIIALLIGILLPAIGKAREQAKLTQSQSNLRNLAAAHATYSRSSSVVSRPREKRIDPCASLAESPMAVST